GAAQSDPVPGRFTDLKSWQEITQPYILEKIDFKKGLSPDSSVYAPIAPLSEDPGAELSADLETIQVRLPNWAPGQIKDPVQRVRNLLLVAAVPDVLQVPPEAYVPIVVFAEIQRTVPHDDLVKVLGWIALTPNEASVSAAREVGQLGFSGGLPDMMEARDRATMYAVKLLGHLLGERPL